MHAIETDFAELILQLDGDWSSHILVPAIHRNRSEIRDLFLRTIADGPLSDDPHELAETARVYLREKFLTAKVGVSGANFGVAETGTVVVVESEGNGRMCTTLPPVLVTVVGIEKLVPTFADLEVYLQLLPRSSTGERMNPYTSLWTGVTDGDGPQEFHVVLLDNGRTRVLADAVGRQALHCIRCSACLNVCPGLLPDGRSRLRLRVSGPDRCDPHAAASRRRERKVAAVRIDTVRCLLRGVPGQDRHSGGAAAPARRGRREGRRHARARGDARRRARVRERAAVRARPAPGAGCCSALRGICPGRCAAWTRTRELKPIATQTFREWWSRERGA